MLVESNVWCAEALQTALDLVREAAAERDSASPEGHHLREVMTTIEAVLAQRGVRGGRPGDDSLVGFMDLCLFG